MATLPTLIKQCEQTLESLQKDISTRQTKHANLTATIQTHKQEAKSAFTDAQKADDPNQLAIALNFTYNQDVKIKECLKKQEKLTQEIVELNNKIRAQFAEKKRYEILLERQQQEARQTYLKKQQNELDDLAQNKRL